MFELWLDSAKLNYSEFSFLSFSTENPTQKFADNLLFLNKAPKEDLFEGRLDASFVMRIKIQEEEKTFVFSQPNVTVFGKVSHIKCRGGKVTQTELMADWLTALASDNLEDYKLLRYPIEGKYSLFGASLDVLNLVKCISTLSDFSDCNPKFFEEFVSNLIKDKRFWARAKLNITGNLPTSCYLPNEKQQIN